MNTDEVIARLARSDPPKALFAPTLVLAGLVGLGVASALFIASAGARSDLATAWTPTGFKIAFALVALVALAPFAWRAARPNVRLRETLAPTLVLAALAALVTATGLATTTPDLRWVVWTGGGAPDCLVRIPLIALPIAAALFLAARRLGPTRLSAAGGALGAVAGALAAIPYSLFCPIDSAPYVATWYSAAIAICAGIGALAGGRLLRW